MYCNNCGQKAAKNAKVCQGCGTSLTRNATASKQEPDTGKPTLVLRPVFIGWAAALSVLPIQIFMTLWGAGFLGGFSMLGLKELNLPLPSWVIFAIFGCLFFFGIPLLVYFARKKTYAKTEYKFHKDRLEYVEGFWTAEKKTVKYDKITETAMREGVIQKKYELGTIFLSTPATGFNQGQATSGIKIQDIKYPTKIYEAVQHCIGK